MGKPNATIRLTKKSLQQLKDHGFRYVLVKGYTPDKRFDYIELNYFTLVPVMELPEDPAQKEIFAPIDSDILDEWASQPENGIKAFIEEYIE
ncbi:MAG: hypothetical protein JST42_02130 [Bacteroidetes bacterium]|nr:hypothetical protein [Bacteroidota bacterium]